MPVHDSPPRVRFEAEIPRGEVIGRHVILNVVGRGATGTVYKAFDTHLNRTLAIKILHGEHASHAGGDAIGLRMQREAQAMARLTHPNVVVVHDVGEFDQRIFLAMEFVDGGTLKTWLRGEHTWRERLAVLMSAGRGLAAAHAAGLVHRDFKPDNVLVGKDGRVLVTDFGLARIADEPESHLQGRSHPSASHGAETEHDERGMPAPADAPTGSPVPPPNRPPHASRIVASRPSLPSSQPSPRTLLSVAPAPGVGSALQVPAHSPISVLPSASLSAPLTLTGSILGTVGYMAPEQAFGEPTNAASDQFSFCVTLYAALYGRRPFPGDDIDSYFRAIERPLAAPPSDATVPAWVHRILARGLARHPENRFPSMDALLAALEDDPEVRRGKRLAVLGAFLAMAVTLGAIFFAVRRTEECTADPTDLKGVWDDAARDDLRAAFARSGAADPGSIATRVVAVLNDTAAKWTAMKTESCEATRIKRRQPEDAYKLRAECLDRRRSELRALAASFRGADQKVVEKAVAASYGLTNVAFCADVPMLRKSGGLPDAPDARAKVVEARTGLARATSLELVGKLADSAGEASRALELARDSKHAPTVAESLRILGALKVEQNEHEQAERLLTEATWTASKAGADSIAVEAASMTAFVVGAKLGRPGEARIWLGVAEAALGRVGPSQALELAYEEHKSWILADGDGRAEDTIDAQKRIAQTYQDLYGTHPWTLRALYNLGDGLTSIGDHVQACDVYARAIAMGDAISGPNYGWTGYSLGGRGDCLIAQGDYAGGDKALARAIGIFEATSDDYSEVETLEVVIRSALQQGDIPRAVATARKALALLENLEGTSSLVAIGNVPAAEALMHAPPAPEAEALCAEAEHQQELLGHVDPSKTLRADALRCLGDALILEGRPQDALPYLERSLTILHRTYPGDLARARFAMARALVLSGGDGARADALARQARDELAAAPGLKYELETVQRWIAARTASGRAE